MEIISAEGAGAEGGGGSERRLGTRGSIDDNGDDGDSANPTSADPAAVFCCLESECSADEGKEDDEEKEDEGSAAGESGNGATAAAAAGA